ncbi:DUF3237 domain-containing protein [Galactobacter valiniphilus]|uniref:DUF3237 domain-containing protein n=1 Tax=Galactobacter valiniphilus TaxID=2676122 RepID=UPI003736620E
MSGLERVVPPVTDPGFEFVFEIRAACAPDVHVGRGSDEVLGFTPVVGGSVSGPRLSGRVLSGGGDWNTKRGETWELEARYLLETNDGAVIDIINRGYFRATEAAMERMEAGELVAEDDPDVYFRTAAAFRTDAPRYRWLTEHQFIGKARDEDGQVCIRIFRLL